MKILSIRDETDSRFGITLTRAIVDLDELGVWYRDFSGHLSAKKAADAIVRAAKKAWKSGGVLGSLEGWRKLRSNSRSFVDKMCKNPRAKKYEVGTVGIRYVRGPGPRYQGDSTYGSGRWEVVADGKVIVGFFDTPTGYPRDGGSGRGAAINAAWRLMGFRKASDKKMRELLKSVPKDWVPSEFARVGPTESTDLRRNPRKNSKQTIRWTTKKVSGKTHVYGQYGAQNWAIPPISIKRSFSTEFDVYVFDDENGVSDFIASWHSLAAAKKFAQAGVDFGCNTIKSWKSFRRSYQ